MLGHKLVQRLSERFDVYYTVRGPITRLEQFPFFDRKRGIADVDLVKDSDLDAALEFARPNVVINAAGMIKQLPESEDVVNTLLVNSILPHRLYRYSRSHGFRLITISTDCVFLGARGNYSECDSADALDLYGRSKKFGEVVGDGALSIRTSIVGRELVTSHGLVEWFLKNRGGTVKGYSRAIYSGFPTMVFADIIADLLERHAGLSGLYHVSSEPIDKFRLLALINDAFGSRITIEKDSKFAIDRSLDSTKFRKETGFVPDSWENMIERMAADTTPYDDWHDDIA